MTHQFLLFFLIITFSVCCKSIFSKDKEIRDEISSQIKDNVRPLLSQDIQLKSLLSKLKFEQHGNINERLQRSINSLANNIGDANCLPSCPPPNCCKPPDCEISSCLFPINAYSLNTGGTVTDLVFTYNNGQTRKATITRIPNTITGVSIDMPPSNGGKLAEIIMITKDGNKYVQKLL